MRRQSLFMLLPYLAAFVLMAASCTHNQNNPVPKPEAWPRITVPDGEYHAEKLNGVNVTLNNSASIHVREPESGKGLWFDLCYPQFPEATIYLSLSDFDNTTKLDEAIANRRERMRLNSGGATTELTELISSGGWHSEMAFTRSSLTTPVQILAHDGHHRLLSGTLYLNYPPATSPDSIAPIVSSVGRDLMELLRNLDSE